MRPICSHYLCYCYVENYEKSLLNKPVPRDKTNRTHGRASSHFYCTLRVDKSDTDRDQTAECWTVADSVASTQLASSVMQTMAQTKYSLIFVNVHRNCE